MMPMEDFMGRTPAGQTREQVFRFIRDCLLKGLPPTVREVQDAFGFRSVQTARQHLELLVKEGRLTKEKGKARSYRLPEFTTFEMPTQLVPLLGRVQAGPLDLATQDLEGYLPIQTRHDADELFGLRVQGESMTAAGILPGDIVVVRCQPTADSGDIVVALVRDEATVKRLRIRKNRVELHPENPDFQPIIPETEDFRLLGKVIEVRRYMELS
jgi:repressor LexA